MRTLIMLMTALLTARGAAAQGPPAGQGRPNLQVLQDVPESQLFIVMNAVASSLGVGCEHCHMRNAPDPKSVEGGWLWDRDDKPAKVKAREMMRMVRDLNRSRFEGRTAVTCVTCHRGSTRVTNLPSLPPPNHVLPPATDPLPRAADIVARYVAAVGGTAAVARRRTLIMEGRDERWAGRYDGSGARNGEIKIVTKGTDLFRIDWRVPPEPAVSQVIAGTTGWASRGGAVQALSAESVARVRRTMTRYAPLKIVEPVETLRVDRMESIRGRDAYVVSATLDGQTSHTYFFDVANGLLVRELLTTPTPLLPLQEQVDYDDYRPVSGLTLPFVVRTSDDAPWDTSLRTFTITYDGAVDDSLFAMPKPLKF